MPKSKLKIQLNKQNSRQKTNVSNLLIKDTNKILSAGVDKASSEIQSFLIKALLQSDTYRSLVGSDGQGILKRDFGFDINIILALENFIDDLIKVESTKSRSFKIFSFNFFINIDVTPDTDLYSFITEKGDVINWLNWLLYAGTSPVVTGYRVKQKIGSGRSELGIMIENTGSNYSVPFQFAGTAENNWLTRIVLQNKQNIEEIIRKNVTTRK